MAEQAVAWAPSFSDRVFELLDRVDYRQAETEADKEAIFRLRYDAYLREGAILPDFGRQLADRFDDTENSWSFGIHLDGRLVSSLRIHFASSRCALSPAVDAFADILRPELERGKTIVDPNRFVTDLECARAHPELPYVSLRIAVMANIYFEADIVTATVRPEHQAFYRRVFTYRPVASPRPYPTLTKPLGLMTVDLPALRDQIVERHAFYHRYPFFRSTQFERRMLFERRPASVGADWLPTARVLATANDAQLATG